MMKVIEQSVFESSRFYSLYDLRDTASVLFCSAQKPDPSVSIP